MLPAAMQAPGFIRSHPQATAILLAGVVIVAAIGVAEWALARSGVNEWPFLLETPRKAFRPDALGLIRPQPNARLHIRSVRRATGETVIDVVKTTDSYARRTTRVPAAENRDRFLLLFGGSFVWGWGTEDSDTLASQLAAQTHRFIPYNYGVEGHGPAEMLVKLQSQTLADEIEPREGLLLYIFTDPDVTRSIGTSEEMAILTGPNKPYFHLTEDGRVERRGTFATGRPWRTWLFRWFGSSQLLGLLDVRLPLALRDEHYDYTAALLAEARDEFQRQFPGQRFAVVIHPESDGDPDMPRALAARGVETLDIATLYERRNPELIVAPGDNHPNLEANRRIARHLVEVLDLE